MKKLLLCVSLVVLLMLPAGAQAIGIEFALGGWYQNPSGNLSYKAVSATDTLDIENDLGYSSQFKFMGRVKLDMPLLIPNIYIMVTPMSFSGTGQKGVSFTFGDVTFNPSVNFDSTLTLTHYDVGLYYGIPFGQTVTLNKFNLDVGLNLRIMDLKAEISQGSISESQSVMAPIPMLFVAAQFKPIDSLSIEAEGRGIAWSGNSYISLLARLKYKIFGPLFGAGGYRYDTIKVDVSDVNLDINFSGFFFEAGFEL